MTAAGVAGAVVGVQQCPCATVSREDAALHRAQHAVLELDHNVGILAVELCFGSTLQTDRAALCEILGFLGSGHPLYLEVIYIYLLFMITKKRGHLCLTPEPPGFEPELRCIESSARSTTKGGWTSHKQNKKQRPQTVSEVAG